MITLETILEKGFLKHIHDDIRNTMRKNHLPQALLVKDATLLSAFQFEMDDSLRVLRQEVLQGRYRPGSPLVVRAAKGTGLRRPLSFLRHDDAVLVCALAKAAQNGIQTVMAPWVSFGRADQTKDRKGGPPRDLATLDAQSSTWFEEWMRYRGLLKVIQGDDREFLALTDVTNFFPCLDLEILRHNFGQGQFLDGIASNLLFYLLEQLVSTESYIPRSKLGLPQDPYSASRVLANLYLLPLDKELEKEGREGRYTRWVDDLAISVESESEGERVISRIQDALTKIQLAPNASKTRVMTKRQFREEHLEKYNGFLDAAHRRADMGTVSLPFRSLFDRRLRGFLAGPKTGQWERVLRRFYTESRRVGAGRLVRYALKHIEEFPAEAPHVLDYLCFRPAHDNATLVDGVFSVLRSSGELYEDIQILCLEWLLAAPFPNDRILRSQVTMRAFLELRGRGSLGNPSAYVRGLLSFVVIKFGGAKTLPALLASFRQHVDAGNAFTVNALYAMCGDQATYSSALAAAEHLRDPEVARLRRFLTAVRNGERKAVGIALGLVSTCETELPNRVLFRARALPMLYLLRSLPAVGPRLRAVEQQNGKHLARQANASLHDAVMESHL